jgi:hypothetical protein
MRPRFGGGFENYSGRAPSSSSRMHVARNGLSPSSKPGGEREAVVIENDLKNLGAPSWCERSDVPLAFVAGDADPSATTG